VVIFKTMVEAEAGSGRTLAPEEIAWYPRKSFAMPIVFGML
jgi:hypothetical protein